MPKKKRLSVVEKDRIRRMKWWHEAKFGMFINLGLYSVIGRHEWAMEYEAIPVAEYEQLAKKFKPRPNCAKEWAKLAKRAGMKYMVFDCKHHEGFCLFNSQYTDYCAPKQAGGRDLVAEYVTAARAEGLRVGLFYSLLDWHHPDGLLCLTGRNHYPGALSGWHPPAGLLSMKNEAARKRFVAYIHGQIRELLTNYGKIDILWYDVSWPLDAKGWESKKMNRMVFKLQPDIIVNDRNQLPGDFSTPEQHITADPEGRAWEACMTMNGSWGYQKNDDVWKSPKQIIWNLAKCACDGGNYLLNIGPKPDGSVPAPSVRILNKVGEWMDKYGHTIYGADPYEGIGSLFAVFTRKGKTLYVHVLYWPGESWAIGGLKTKVKSAELLCTGQKVKFEQDRLRVRFSDLPAKAPDSPVTVLKLECASVPKQDYMFIRANMKRGKA